MHFLSLYVTNALLEREKRWLSGFSQQMVSLFSRKDKSAACMEGALSFESPCRHQPN